MNQNPAICVNGYQTEFQKFDLCLINVNCRLVSSLLPRRAGVGGELTVASYNILSEHQASSLSITAKIDDLLNAAAAPVFYYSRRASY